MRRFASVVFGVMNTGSDRGGDRDAGADRPEADGAASGGRVPGSRAPAFVRERRALHVSWQVAVFLVGLAVVAAGVLMLALPGPGWVVIFGGMAIWGTEFAWAQLVLRWTKRKVTEAAQRALDPRVRRRNIVLTVIGTVVAAALISVYLGKYGFRAPWSTGGP